jgi:ATP-dependent DNA ligase
MFPTAPRHPAQLYLFDVLYQGGQLLLGVPYTARRERLEELGLEECPVRMPPWYPGQRDIWAASAAMAWRE